MKKNPLRDNLRNELLEESAITEQMEHALQSMIEADAPMTQQAVVDATGLTRHQVDLLLPHYIERKSQRIELRCTWVQKKRWEHKARRSGRSVSVLAAHSLDQLTLHIPPTEQLKQTFDRVVVERVRFNSLVNQIARWCNTHPSAVKRMAMEMMLGTLTLKFEEHDRQVMSLLKAAVTPTPECQHKNGEGS